MCGIAGIFNYADPSRPIDTDELLRMTRRLSHRGPDDEGVHVETALGLGHRRLAIVDLTPSGHQPMAVADGKFWLTYNGELYNHASFRPRLENRGWTFRGTSDTETLLAMVSEYGPRILSEAAGIFAFAFWDGDARRLILARDQLGVKQVYYYDDGRRIVFASEIKAVLEADGVPGELDPDGLNDYLHFHTPLFERTFFKGIRQVQPGEFLEIDRHGLRRRRYAETDGFEARHETPAQSVDALRSLLDSVVREQLMSDVPVGSFFSGGVDSSAIAAFAKRSGSVKCFGIHFTDQGIVDERPYQEAAARALGLDLELTTVDASSFPADLLRLTWFQDQPVIGAALIPMYHVSRLAARHVKVCLGGQGADEVFGGYARYALANPAGVIRSWFARSAGGGPSAAPTTGPKGLMVGGNLLKQLGSVRNLRRLVRRARPGESWSGRYFANFAEVPEREWHRVFPRELVSRSRARGEFDDVIARSPARTPGDKLLHWDIQTYLPGLFQQDDRMSMANSLESRVPLADPRVVRFALHTSFDLKLKGGATKWLLRQAVADVIPSDVLNRRKVGFDTPVEAWMRGPHRQFIHDLLLSSSSRTRGYWNADGIRQVLERPSSSYWFPIVWKLASIEAWANSFLDAQPRSAPPVAQRVYAST